MLPPRSLRSLVYVSLLSLPGLILLQPGQADDAKSDGKQEATIDFNRQIRPILSEYCFACHGPDEKSRKAKLRLDTREGAFAKLRGGGLVIVPGKSADSELIQRVLTHDETELMPPPKYGKKLTDQQKALLKQWVEQGASWSSHWAFVAPTKPALPRVKKLDWPRNPVDHFTLARLEKEGLQPSPEADKTAWLRRVTFDLTGLPPTLAESDAFLADASPQAQDKVVDRLLESPRYGEHMARFWLDAARYGDTHGMHLDNYREIWPYREWVIHAFNKNQPFDRFLVEQLAGDLLPDATLEQKVATGFIRCHVTTNEGGSIDEEVYVRNVVDRVDTNGTVLLGLSIGCARCHDHRYDPVSMKDYYQMFAFFNNLDGSAMDGNVPQHPPFLKLPSPEQATALDQVQKKIAGLEKKIGEVMADVKYEEAPEPKTPAKPERTDFVWLDDQLPLSKALPTGGPNVAWQFVKSPEPVLQGSKSVKLHAQGLQQVVLMEANPGLRVGEGDRLFAHVYLDPAKPPREIMLQWHSKTWLHRAYWGENVIPFGKDNTGERRAMGPLPKAGEWVRLEVEASRVDIKPGTVLNGFAFTQQDGLAYWDKAGLVTQTPQGSTSFETLTAWLQTQRGTGGANLPKDLQALVKLEPAKHTTEQKKKLRDYFLQYVYPKTQPTFAPLNDELGKLTKERDQLEKQIPTTLIFKEKSEIRPAYILKRGEYDQRGEQVQRNTPAFLPPLPASAAKNRLGFARWLVARDHPLTARVAVNRLWQQCFGTGLVKTAEDFGSQGEPPSHPELLDWLAVQFIDDGWDVKKMMKRLVTSATYRQSAKITKDRLAKDPHNRLLSRGPRFRLDAEMLRDQALFVSGLLVEKVGGPSVKPPQPAGLWEAVAFTGSNTGKFSPDTGHDKVHRRSMYIFWKRTAAPPQMNALDAPSREACTVRRERTNTPLQALLLMNEQQFVEAARALGERTMKQGGATLEDRLRFLFRTVTIRNPEPLELSELRTLFSDNLKNFQTNPKAADQLIAVGETRPDATLNPSELAAWTMVANLVLNLDEVIAR
jgi:hypothetical protein